MSDICKTVRYIYSFFTFPPTGPLEAEFPPVNTIKGKICTKTIVEEFQNHTNSIEFSIKPKVALLTVGL